MPLVETGTHALVWVLNIWGPEMRRPAVFLGEKRWFDAWNWNESRGDMVRSCALLHVFMTLDPSSTSGSTYRAIPILLSVLL